MKKERVNRNHLAVSPFVKGREELDFVFCKENGFPFSGNYVSKTFKNACRAVGIDEGIHFHSIRHATASNLVQKGVSIYAIKALLGHSSITTTEIYAHLNMDSLKEAIEKFNSPKPDLSKERIFEEENLKLIKISMGE